MRRMTWVELCTQPKTMSDQVEKKRRPFTGIWEIQDAQSGARILRFRSFGKKDVNLQMRKATIGLKRPIEDFKAVYIADWVDTSD